MQSEIDQGYGNAFERDIYAGLEYASVFYARQDDWELLRIQGCPRSVRGSTVIYLS